MGSCHIIRVGMSTGDCSSEVMVKNLTGGNFVLATEVLEMTHGCAESALGKKETKQYRFGLKSRKRIVFSPKRPKKIHLMKKDNSKRSFGSQPRLALERGVLERGVLKQGVLERGVLRWPNYEMSLLCDRVMCCILAFILDSKRAYECNTHNEAHNKLHLS